MDRGYMLKEYWQFLKENIKLIILVTVVTLLAFVGVQLLSDDAPATTKNDHLVEVEFDDELMQEYLNEDFDLLTEIQQGLLLEYLASEAYTFEFYIEDENQNPYTQYRTLKELLTTKEMTQKIEEKVGFKFKPDSKRGVILGLEPGTNLMWVTVGVGDEEANLAFAQAYLDLLSSEDFNFLENKTIYLINNEPIPVESLETTEPESVEAPMTGNSSVIVTAILAATVGVIAGIIVAFIKLFTSKRISYLYDYDTSEDVRIYKFLSNKNHRVDGDISYAVAMPPHSHYMLLTESALAQDQLTALEQTLPTNAVLNRVHDLSTIAVDDQLSSQIVVLIERNKTTKEWYKNQRNKLELLNVAYKIVQI